uniref:Major facilitator superfamily (MFS) profile domain-containing protein n=1 Tax=Panagrolaimus sp. JU765 TaxID=591449 RepID=A0AC34PW22_9BILA
MLFNINRFHAFVLLTWQFGIFFASQQIFPIFSNYVPKWRCSSDEEFSKNCTIFAKCNGTVEFDIIYFKSSAMEYEWICGSNAYWAAFYSQLQFIGVLIGTFTCGRLSDWLGRKPVALTAMTVGITISLLSAFSPTWQILLASRFVIGLSIGGTLVVVCTFVMEMILPEQRMALRAFFNWGVARLLMTIICYFFDDWRSATIACAVFASPAIIILLFIFPESPTWLHYKGRLQEMRESEKRMAKFAGVEYVEIPHAPVVHKKSFIDIVRDWQMFKRISVLWSMWFVASICGYAIDLNSSNISGDLFMNQVIFSILIAGSKIVLVTFDTLYPSFSRRNLHQGSQGIAVICFLILTILTLFHYDGMWILVVNVIGTVFIEMCWDACYLCGVEVMPTAMRATTMGSCSLIARIGAIMAPMLAHMNSIWQPSPYLTVVVLGTLNLFVSYNWLVETKGINLDHVEIENDSELNKAEEDVKMLPQNLKA